MKTVFVALNAKYIHSGLAVRCIAKYCAAFAPVVREYSINESIDGVIASLYEEKADVIAFSCYIWNVEEVLYIAEMLRKVQPKLKIILGGHEVSYNAKSLLMENPAVDFVVRGEGEKPMHALLGALSDGKEFESVPSLSWRSEEGIEETPLCATGDLNTYPFPYDETIRELRSKIIYYESARGCPFQCSYCLSGKGAGVQYLSMDRVKRELLFFIENEVPLVKFVDRTFNADRKRAAEFFRFIIENRGKTKFHFELAGNLLDEESFAVLEKAPKDLIQFEIGVQTTNPKTMQAIGRNIAFADIVKNVKRLMEMGNIHVHLDLIAGLPYEDLASFIKSFDDVMAMRPHVLQLGFLKLLKGSRIREEAEKMGYIYKTKPPYEVMANRWMSFAELILLKDIEEILEIYYNSGNFKRTMEFLFARYLSPFSVLEKIYTYYKEKGMLRRPLKIETRYAHLPEIFPSDDLADYVRADLLTNPAAKVPYESDLPFKEACFAFLKNEVNVEKYLPHHAGETARTIYKHVRFARLFQGVYLCENGSLTEVTGDF